MKKYLLLLILFSFGIFRGFSQTVVTGASNPNGTQVSLTSGGYTQNFTTSSTTNLVNSGSAFQLPAGWYFSESGFGSNGTYTANNGASTTGDTYSYGGGGNINDRAFGTLRANNNFEPRIGASFVNNTGNTIRRLSISYTGEQWRRGTQSGTGTDALQFNISSNATDINTGTFIRVPILDFNSPDRTSTGGTRDGNNGTFRTSITFEISGFNIAPGATFWIRWDDKQVNGTPALEDGLAVDDFTITPFATDNNTQVSFTSASFSAGPPAPFNFDIPVSIVNPSIAQATNVNVVFLPGSSTGVAGDIDFAPTTLTLNDPPANQRLDAASQTISVTILTTSQTALKHMSFSYRT